ncbi:peptidyl-prolyl cis-trans isomerase [Deinococcus deserti]|uniref:peptidylprolyl isomerase n=1 Tax=Deinococcus deserti (strain DSM 17065 / CIP 109153 / LMG 22923 / VCD115) TaxID=546414 RepID=C1D144_DEIDV|nr:peptidyl-prolyl cis-trans isomerase [Deinococcus deserti]ACO45568.1 putative PpiC-type peptidyl-prolyl cis-trans isomerase precursor [Deinococcus deserti VCD115]
MNRKKVVNGLLIVLALLLVVGMAYQFTPSLGSLFSSPNKGTPALVVNGKTVTAEELDGVRRSNPVLSSTDTGILGDDFKTFTVAQKVRQVLVAQAASDIKVSRDDVNAEVKKIREANSLTDSKAWTDALQGVGLTDATYRAQLREQLAVNRKVEELRKAVPAATEAEAKLYYDLNPEKFQSEARIIGRQIVVAKEAKAKELLAQVRGGADFAAVAKANSTEFADRGGALGPVENGKPRPVAQVALPAEVGAAAFALTKGGITDVVASGDKFYIVKVEQYLAPATKPFAEAKADAITAVTEQKKNAALEEWVEGLEKDVKIEVKDPNWRTENPVVATVGGQNVRHSDVISQVVGNEQFGQLLQQVPGDQAAQLVNGMLKPQVTQQLISSYAAPQIARSLKLPVTGTRQEMAAAIAAYGSRNVKVTDADVQAFYTQNKAQFQSPATATVDEASFKDRSKALAFRNTWNGQGSFATAASKQGGTVSERGSVTAGDGKLGQELNAAVFSARTLKSAGEGSLSDVVKVGERYSVAYVTDLKPATTQPLSAVRSQIESQVLATKRNEAGQAFLAKQVAALNPTDKLKEVLAAQEKRVAAAAPKAAPKTDSSKPSTGATPETKSDSAAPPAEK